MIILSHTQHSLFYDRETDAMYIVNQQTILFHFFTYRLHKNTDAVGDCGSRRW